MAGKRRLRIIHFGYQISVEGARVEVRRRNGLK